MSCKVHARIDSRGRYSKAIDECIVFLRRANFLVIPYAEDLPKDIAGRTNYEERWVKINCPCAGCALIAFAHEIGHVLTGRFTASRKTREREAHERGWLFLGTLGVGDILPRKHYDTCP